MMEGSRDKNPKTTLYCGMTASNSPVMFESMDAALKNGAEGVSIFTIGGLRSPEIRRQFKAYADSARAARASAKVDPEETLAKKANANPFENKGIMKAVELHIRAHLSLANAIRLPELELADKDAVESIFAGALRANSPEDYVDRLVHARRRDPALQPLAEAIADQFKRDSDPGNLQLGEYKLSKAYGVTKVYQVKELNSQVTFNVTFYFYGGILSGWNVAPEETSLD
jgi:hypothetical protein